MPTFTITHALWAAGIASGYAAWAIVGKYLGLTGAWVTIIVLIGTTVGGIGIALNDARNETVPPILAITSLFVVSLLNGVAVYQQALKTVDKQVPTVSFITTIIIGMLVMTALYNFVLNGEVLATRQWIGLGMALVTVFILVG